MQFRYVHMRLVNLEYSIDIVSILFILAETIANSSQDYNIMNLNGFFSTRVCRRKIFATLCYASSLTLLPVMKGKNKEVVVAVALIEHHLQPQALPHSPPMPKDKLELAVVVSDPRNPTGNNFSYLRKV